MIRSVIFVVSERMKLMSLSYEDLSDLLNGNLLKADLNFDNFFLQRIKTGQSGLKLVKWKT